MSDGTQASLLLLALLSALGLVPLVSRGMKPKTILVLHLVGLFVVFSVAIASRAPSTTTHMLGLPYLVMLVLVVVDRRRERSPFALRALASAVVAFGLLAPMATQVWPVLVAGVTVTGAFVAVAFTLATVVFVPRFFRAPQSNPQPIPRLTKTALVVAALALALPLLSFIGVGEVAHMFWPLALGAAGGVVVSSRAAPHVQPTPRELVVGAFLGIATFFVVTTIDGPAVGATAAVFVTLFDVGLVAASRPLLESAGGWARRDSPPPPPVESPVVDPVSPEALAALTPLLDHDAVQRPPVGAVVVRITAQSLLDAAIEHARQLGERQRRAKPRVTLVVEDAEADLECDPSELSRVLGDLLLLARVETGEQTDGVRVQLRAGPRQVTYEITSDPATQDVNRDVPAFDIEHPFTLVDGATPGLTLSRARVVIERNAGTFIYRSTERGHFVQVTLPRRIQRARAARA